MNMYEKDLMNKAAFYSYKIAEIAEGHEGDTVLSDLEIKEIEGYLEIIKICKKALK